MITNHYKSEAVKKFIATSQYTNYVTLVHEKELLDTGGTLLLNRKFWQNQETLVAHADNFTLSTLSGLVKAHQLRKSHIDVTMLLFETDTPESCGVVKIDEQNHIYEYHEKVATPPSNLANGATFIFSPNVFQKYFASLSSQKKYSLCADIVPNMIGYFQGWQVDDFYIDIGTPLAYKKANSKVDSL